MNKKYFIEQDNFNIEVPEDIKKQIVLDHLERYYLLSLTIGIFIIGFLLGIIAYAL